MLRRLLIVIGLAGLAGGTAITACSSSQRRDQNYGSEVGSDYSPEAGVFGESEDALSDDAGDGGDAAQTPDATYSTDRAQAEESKTDGAQPNAAAEPDADLTP
jgi:hypothetical protein